MTNSGIQIRVSDLLFALQKKWAVIVSLTIVGLIFGLILSGMTYVQSSFQNYEIAGSYAVTTRNSNGQYLNGNNSATNNDFHLAEDMVDAVIYVIQSDRVMKAVINDEGLIGTTPDQLRNSLIISQHNKTQILEMKLNWRTAEEGVMIWNSILDNTRRILPEVLQIGNLSVINEPSAAIVGAGGESSRNTWMILTVLGFAAGVGYAVMGLLMHPTLNNIRDVEPMFGLETIGVIPKDNKHFRKKTSLLVQDENQPPEIIQNYSAAAYILRNRLGTKDPHHCFFVTSTENGEGKSTVAANIAIQLSDMEHRTLLIDFDTRNPSMGSLFLNGVDYDRSLNALYRGEITEDEAITTLTGYLDLLPTVLEQTAIPMDNTIVELIKRLSEKYEYVILDSAPVGVASEALSLSQVADGALYVIGYDKAAIPEIQSSLERLNKAGIRVLGCVVNGVQSANNSTRDDRRGRAEKKRNNKKEDTVFQPEDASREDPSVTDLLVKDTEGSGKESSEEKRQSRKEQKMRKVQAAATVSPAAGSKNVMEDLLQEAVPDQARTDQETLDALYQIGIEGKGEEAADEKPAELFFEETITEEPPVEPYTDENQSVYENAEGISDDAPDPDDIVPSEPGSDETISAEQSLTEESPEDTPEDEKDDFDPAHPVWRVSEEPEPDGKENTEQKKKKGKKSKKDKGSFSNWEF